jgi:hypothetical protein
MPFVNEQISQEDVKKYDLEASDKHFFVGRTRSRMWTIDRERNIFLRNVTRGREEYKSQSGWIFFWDGYPIYLEIEVLRAGGKPGGPGWSHKKLLAIELPERLKGRRVEILEDLKGALSVYKDFGIFSVCTDYAVTLDI